MYKYARFFLVSDRILLQLGPLYASTCTCHATLLAHELLRGRGESVCEGSYGFLLVLWCRWQFWCFIISGTLAVSV